MEVYDERKYRNLMDGLECNEVLFSKLERTKRIDAEFYKKEAFQVVDAIKKFPNKVLTKCVDVSDGNHMAISSKFIEEGIPYYRGQDVKTFFVENSVPICIDNLTYNLPYMKRSHLKKGDVLLSIVGTIGALSLVYSNQEATCSCKLAILRPRKNFKSEVIAAFLHSKYGQNQIKKLTRGAVQMGLILEDMDQIIVPQFSDKIEKYIQKVVLSAYEEEKEAERIYSETEQFLLDKLGMTEIGKEQENISIKKFSDSFVKIGRVDAEYYQPKFEKLISMLRANNAQLLGGETGIVDMQKSIEPGSQAYVEDGIPFVRVSDVSKFEISNTEIKISRDIVDDIEKLYPEKDTILLSKDGSVGIAYKVEQRMEIVTSSALLHLKVKETNKVLPDYLTLVLNSDIVKLQAERDASGAVIQHWRPADIQNVLIPMVDMKTQKEIAEKIRCSFALRRQSQSSLKNVVNFIENLIEHGETHACSLLKKKGVDM